MYYRFAEWPCIGGYFRNSLTAHLAHFYESVSILITISNKTKEYLPTFPIPKKLTKKTLEELETNIMSAQEYLNNLSDEFSSIVQII